LKSLVYEHSCDKVARSQAHKDHAMRTQKTPTLKRFLIRTELLAAIFLAAACSTEKQPAPSKDHQAEFTLGRLVVSDATTGKVTVIDLDDRSTPGTLSLDNPGAVYAQTTDVGGFIFATQRAQNKTQVLESGTAFEQHEDHFHITKEAPRLMTKAIEGAQPTHYTRHAGWSALFNDGDGTVDLIKDEQLARGEMNPMRARTGTAHHGVAIVHGERLVASMSAPDTQQLPDGGTMVRQLAAGATSRELATVDTVADTFKDCVSLHGEFSTSKSVAFGCANGALVMDWADSTKKFEGRVIPNPAGSTERVGTVEGHEKWPVFIGNFDRTPANGLAIIDPRNNSITPLNLPTRRFAFRVDEGGKFVVALTMDGNLHRFQLNAAATALEAFGAPLQVIPSYDMWPATPPRPALTLGWNRAYVSDPRNGTIKEIELSEWKVGHEFSVGGAPASLTVTSMSPDWRAKPAP
jgi:hypothetical protein